MSLQQILLFLLMLFKMKREIQVDTSDDPKENAALSQYPNPSIHLPKSPDIVWNCRVKDAATSHESSRFVENNSCLQLNSGLINKHKVRSKFLMLICQVFYKFGKDVKGFVSMYPSDPTICFKKLVHGQRNTRGLSIRSVTRKNQPFSFPSPLVLFQDRQYY